MNICLINNLFPPILTGSSLFTLDLATQLHKSGHNIIVITSRTKRSARDFEIHENGFKLYRLKKLRIFESNLWMNFPNFFFTLFPSNFRRIKKIIIENEIDVIHQCNNIFDIVFASAFFAEKLKLPLICSLTTQIQHANPYLNKFWRYLTGHLLNTYLPNMLMYLLQEIRKLNDISMKDITGIKASKLFIMEFPEWKSSLILKETTPKLIIDLFPLDM